jgi:hypothetical protein
MKMKSLLIPALSLIFATAALAQNAPAPNPPDSGNSGEENGIQGYWEIELPTGRFIARLDQITSVSQHTYIIDPGVRVYEVTVDTDGSMTARFYFLEPITDGSPLSLGKNTIDRLREVAGEAGSRVGIDTERDVTKHYPTTTHAKTAEYRIVVKENIERIYNHVHKVWAEERGRGKSNKLTIRDE